MSFAYRLRVYSDGRELKRGTAWFMRADLVVTAFHVVSDDAGAWLHEHDPTVQYRLELADQEAVVLQAVTEDKAADIALLRFESLGREVSVLELAGDSPATLRLKKESDRLQQQWELLNEKLSGLNEQWIRETRFEEKWRLKKLIDDTQIERDQIGEQLKDLESGGLVGGIITQMTDGALRALLSSIPEAKPLLTPSQTEWVRTILQELASPDVRGIALLEPLHFGARYVVEQVIARLQQAGGPAP